jgi:transmembrane sensor
MSFEREVTALEEVAARWHERLQHEPVPQRLRMAFSRWLDKAPENRTAYAAVDRVWRFARSAAHDARILELRHETALRLTRKASHRPRSVGWAAAATILACLGGVLLYTQRARLLDWSGSSRTAGVYETAVGERLTVTLVDGSRVTLNTDTVLRPAFDAHERRVVLERGQALFEVAKDSAHPFVVETAQRRFVAVGTAFDVRIDGERVQVTMLEGTVRVERGWPGETASLPANASDAMSDRAAVKSVVATITAGEQLTMLDERQDRIQVTEPDRVTSWRRGQVIFEASRLADAVAEINRYSSVKIELAEGALADLRISGAFATGRPTVFVEAMTSYFPVDATIVDDDTVLLSSRKTASETAIAGQ